MRLEHLPAPTWKDRSLAVLILVLLLGLLYALLLHPLWVRPMWQQHERIVALQQRQVRAQAQLDHAPHVQQALAELQQQLATVPSFLPEASAELAVAGLIQRLESMVQEASPDKRSCTISQRSPLNVPVNAQVPYTAVAIQVRLRCAMRETMQLLDGLENGAPRLFVDNLQISTEAHLASAELQVEGPGGLDVSFDLYGYLMPQASRQTAQQAMPEAGQSSALATAAGGNDAL